MEPRTPPTDPVAQYQQALALHQAGRLDEAAKLYRAMLEPFPGNPLLMAGLGTIALQQGNLDEGVRELEAALLIEPDQPMALSNLGMALRSLKRLDEALERLDRAVALAPEFAEAHNHRGIVLRDLKRLDEALAACDRAAALNPGFAQAWNNRGVTLQELNRWPEALASFDRALALNPHAADVHSNRARVLRDLGRLDDSLAACNAAIDLDPGYAPAWLNKAVLLLLSGNYEEGWRLYEWRWKDPEAAPATEFAAPLWLGESSLAGKTLLIDLEQGMGDLVQFCRYVPMAEAQGAAVVIEVSRPLVPLIATLKGNFTLVVRGEALPHFDVHCPLMTLPLAFRTTVATIPGDVPYLYADPARGAIWRQRLGPKSALRVGVVWSGNPAHKNDLNRSIPLPTFAALFELPVEFHVLQKDIQPGDAALLSRFPNVHVHAAQLGDFADTAALMQELDLVISVDTSVAHVAGAAGLPLWLLLPFNPDYRWFLGRSDSPWYPTATLFRQAAIGDWRSVMAKVAARLKIQHEPGGGSATEAGASWPFDIPPRGDSPI